MLDDELTANLKRTFSLPPLSSTASTAVTPLAAASPETPVNGAELS